MIVLNVKAFWYTKLIIYQILFDYQKRLEYALNQLANPNLNKNIYEYNIFLYIILFFFKFYK